MPEIYYRQEYTFAFSEQHKSFNDNTQNILKEIFSDKETYCYLTYLENIRIQDKQKNR